MSNLKTAIIIVGGIIVALLLIVLGDYLGYRTNPKRVAIICGIAALVAIVAFAIYAAITLLSS